MDQPLISIIVPVYKAEKYISRCIESLQNQTYENIQIVLINDGSPDNSDVICQKYTENDCRIKYIEQNNAGVSSARNRGIRESDGTLLIFVDSDDFVESNMCEILLKSMLLHDCDMVIGGARHINTYGIEEKHQIPKFVNNDYDKAEFIAEHFCTSSVTAVWGRLFKKSLIASSFDTTLTYAEDSLFNLSYILGTNTFVQIEEVVYNYDKTNENSLTKRSKENYFDGLLLLFKTAMGYMQSAGLSKNKFKNLNRWLITNVLFLINSDVIYCDKKDRNARIKKYITVPEVTTAAQNLDRHQGIYITLASRFIRKKQIYPLVLLIRTRNKKMGHVRKENMT